MVIAKDEIVDVLADLLQAEQACLLHFLNEADPYMGRAAADIRRTLQQMIASAAKREAELANRIIDLNGALLPSPVCGEYQYLAYLSLDYLLPKLAECKKASIVRYERAIAASAESGPAIVELLKRHLEEHHRDLAFYQKVMGQV